MTFLHKCFFSLYLSAKDAMNHDDDETFQRVEDGKQDLEEGGAAVRDGQDSRHPGEGQQGQNHTGAPEWCPEGLEHTLDATDFLGLQWTFSRGMLNEDKASYQTHQYCLCNKITLTMMIKQQRREVIHKTYPALSFSFTSVMPSLETSLLKTRIPMTMFTWSWDKRKNEAMQ